MIDPVTFFVTWIQPALLALGAVEPRMAARPAGLLLLGTALTESHLQFVDQIGGGPARGFFQIEPATFDDVYGRYLMTRKAGLLGAVGGLMVPGLPADGQLRGNPWLGAAIARLRYWMAPAPLPRADDLDGLGRYWKRHYNTAAGAGRPETFVAQVERYVPGWRDIA